MLLATNQSGPSQGIPDQEQRSPRSTQPDMHATAAVVAGQVESLQSRPVQFKSTLSDPAPISSEEARNPALTQARAMLDQLTQFTEACKKAAAKSTDGHIVRFATQFEQIFLKKKPSEIIRQLHINTETAFKQAAETLEMQEQDRDAMRDAVSKVDSIDTRLRIFEKRWGEMSIINVNPIFHLEAFLQLIEELNEATTMFEHLIQMLESSNPVVLKEPSRFTPAPTEEGYQETLKRTRTLIGELQRLGEAIEANISRAPSHVNGLYEINFRLSQLLTAELPAHQVLDNLLVMIEDLAQGVPNIEDLCRTLEDFIEVVNKESLDNIIASSQPLIQAIKAKQLMFAKIIPILETHISPEAACQEATQWAQVISKRLTTFAQALEAELLFKGTTEHTPPLPQRLRKAWMSEGGVFLPKTMYKLCVTAEGALTTAAEILKLNEKDPKVQITKEAASKVRSILENLQVADIETAAETSFKLIDLAKSIIQEMKQAAQMFNDLSIMFSTSSIASSSSSSSYATITEVSSATSLPSPQTPPHSPIVSPASSPKSSPPSPSAQSSKVSLPLSSPTSTPASSPLIPTPSRTTSALPPLTLPPSPQLTSPSSPVVRSPQSPSGRTSETILQFMQSESNNTVSQSERSRSSPSRPPRLTIEERPSGHPPIPSPARVNPFATPRLKPTPTPAPAPVMTTWDKVWDVCYEYKGCEGGWVVFKAVMVVLSLITCFLLPLVLWAGSKLYDYWKGRGVQTL